MALRAVGELTSDLVLARVFDVTRLNYNIPRLFAVDANVLNFVFNPDPAASQSSHAKKASRYSKWLAAAAALGYRAKVCPITMLELLRTIESGEIFRTFILLGGDKNEFNAGPKRARYKLADDMKAIRTKTATLIKSIWGKVDVFPPHSPSSSHPEFFNSMARWIDCQADFPDAMIAEGAAQKSTYDILSDDADLCTFAHVVVHTANTDAIKCAQAAGKLGNP